MSTNTENKKMSYPELLAAKSYILKLIANRAFERNGIVGMMFGDFYRTEEGREILNYSEQLEVIEKQLGETEFSSYLRWYDENKDSLVGK